MTSFITDDNDDKLQNKKRLDSLRSQIISDPVNFNSSLYEMDSDQFPTTNFDDIEKPIDYVEKRKDFLTIATEEISSIIEVYIQDDKLLKSARLISKKNNFIRKYTSLLLILDISEANLITLQESIDVGDRSKDQFDLVNKTGAEISKRSMEIDKLLLDCENFFENYLAKFGMESEEEKIVANSSESEEPEERITILTMTEITNVVQEQLEKEKEKEREKENKENKENGEN